MSFYTVVLYTLYFFCYSFIGWIVESTYCSCGERKWVNRGFLTGPVVPIYGAGTMTMAICLTPIKNLDLSVAVGSHNINFAPVLVFFIGIIVCDIVEFFTSYVMEKLFHARWWDYSNKKFNIQGRICLQHSMYWGVGSVIFLYFIHPITVRCFDRLIEKAAYIAFFVFLTIFIIDVIHATVKAMDVRKFMDKLQKTYETVLSAKDDIKNGVKENAKTGVNYIENKYGNVKEKIDSWRKETNAQLKRMMPSFTSDTDDKDDSSFKKLVPYHHFKSSPNLFKYAKAQLKKLDELFDEIKKNSDK